MKLVTKRFVSLFAAMTMLLSVCGVFASAASNADSIDAGYVLVFDENASNVNTAVVKVQLKNIAGPFSGMNFTLPVDTDIVDVAKLTDASYTFDANVAAANGGASYVEGTGIKMNCASGAGFSLAAADGTVVTIALPLKKAITSSMPLTLSAGKITPAEGNKYQIGAETSGTTVGITAPTVDIPRDPSTPPASATRPGLEIVPPGPTPVDPQPDTGYNLVLDKANTDLTSKVVVKVQLKNIAGPFSGMNFTLPVDTDIVDVAKLTDASYTFDANVAAANGGASYVEGTGIKMNCASGAGFSLAAADGTVVTITLPLKSSITTYTDMTLSAGKITPAEGNKYQIGAETSGTTVGMTAPVLRVDPDDFAIKVPAKKTAALKDYADKDAAAAAKVAEDASKKTYLTVEVKKDGAAAVYGTDFVAEYDGQEIKTVEEYKNIIHGYDETKPISDVINKLIYKFFDSAKYTISTTLNAEGEETQLTNPVTDKEVGGTTQPTDPPKGPSLSDSSVTTSSEKNFDATINIKNAKDGAAVKYTIVKDKKGTEFDLTKEIPSINVYGKALDNTSAAADLETAAKLSADNKTATAKFSAAKVTKKTTAYIKAEYTDTEGNTDTKYVTVTINVGGGDGEKETTSSSDKKGSGGTIAGPADSIGTGGILGAFTDINDADWAKEAITVLSLKGIVSGRGDGTFAPNDNITRAEYCQILIGAIEKNAEYADSEFADVPSDAWFYHAVSVASKYGIVSGYGDGNFGPYDLITRQDMALMTYKAAQVMNKNLSAARTMSFTDAGAISDYAATAVQTLADAAIINGVSDTEFAPRANATRAQASKILYDTFVKAN